jgi:hypothetical protein
MNAKASDVNAGRGAICACKPAERAAASASSASAVLLTVAG